MEVWGCWFGRVKEEEGEGVEMLQGEMIRIWGFCQILPEAKSVFIQMYNLFFLIYLLSSRRGEEKCAKVPRSHWKRERRVIYRGETTLNLYLHAAWDRFHGYLSHPRRMFSRFFTPLPFGCSPPPSPPAFSPPPRSRSPSLLSSSFPACFRKKKRDKVWNNMIIIKSSHVAKGTI